MNDQELMSFAIARSNDPIIKNPVLRDAMNKDLGPRIKAADGGLIDEALDAYKYYLKTRKSRPSKKRYKEIPFTKFFEIYGRENFDDGGRIGYADKNAGKLVKKPRNIGGEIANTKDPKFKGIMGKPELVEVAEAYFPEKNSKNVNWDKVLTIRERTNINNGNYTLEKAKKFITNEDIAKIKKELTKEEFAKLDFDSVVYNISNRRRAGWLGISSQKSGDATKLRQKVARILDGRGLKNPEREASIKKRTADLLKRNNLINEMVTGNQPLNILEMTKKIGLKDRGEYIQNYITDTFGQKKLFKIFPNQRTILEKNVNRLANSKPVLKFLEDGTLLDKKNIQYIAKNFFNNDADLAGRTLFHMAEAAKGEKAYMKNLKLDNLKPFKKQINQIIVAAENDIFGNPAGNLSRTRKERVLADQIGEGSGFFKDSRTNLNKVSKEVFDEFGVTGIGTAVDELATITVPYKFGSPGYSVYQQQLTKTGDKLMDDMNMVKAKRLDRSLVDIRKALSNGTATQDMVDIYNEKVSAIASDINKDVPKNGKKLQPFLIEFGGDPRKTVSNFKTLVKQNPIAAQSMLETAKTQGWSGVIPADVPTIYDLRDTDNVKKEMTNSLQSIFKQKNVNKLKETIKQTPVKKIQQLFKKFGPRFVEAPNDGTRVTASVGGFIAGFLGAEALAFEYGFFEASRRNYLSQGYSEEEAKAMAVDEATFGITNKTDPAYNRQLAQVAKEMGINPKAFDALREISKRSEKKEKQQEADKKLIGSNYFQSKTEEEKNKFLKDREKLYQTYEDETFKLMRKARTDFGIGEAEKVFPSPNLDQIADEVGYVDYDNLSQNFGDMQLAVEEKLKRRKEKAYDVQSTQVNTDQGKTGNLISNNLFNFQSIPRTLKTAYDFINPLSPLPKLDNLKSDAALEQDQMDQMDKRELYLYNKRRGIEKDNPITEESLNEIRSKYSEFGLAQGGLASLKRKL